jgi:Flp pilus assembly protein TadG
MVEFALVLPILVLLVMGVLEFGRTMTVHQILTNGAREGARRAILPGATNGQVTAGIDTYMNNAGIASGFSRSVTALAGAQSGDPITVTISIPFSQIFSAPDWVGLNGVTLSSTVVMRKE